MGDRGKLIKLSRTFFDEKDSALSNVYHHPKFSRDWNNLLPDSGKQIVQTHKLKLRLKVLLETRELTIAAWFEHLGSTNGLCCIKLKGEVNIRVLLVFRNLHQKFCVILLHAFAEKDKKHGGGTSYNDAVKTANSRLSESNT